MRSKLLTSSLIFLVIALVMSTLSPAAHQSSGEGLLVGYGYHEYVLMSWASPYGEEMSVNVKALAIGSSPKGWSAAWNVYKDGLLIATGVAYATFKASVTYSGQYVKVARVDLYATRSVDLASNVKWSKSASVSEDLTLSGSSAARTCTIASSVYLSDIMGGTDTVYLEIRAVITIVGLKSGKTLTLDSGWIRLGKYYFEWSSSSSSDDSGLDTGIYGISWADMAAVRNVFLALAIASLVAAFANRR